MTRKITTAAELDALPWGAVVLGKEARGAYQRGTGGWWVAGTGLFPFTSGELVEFEAFDLVHDPSAPAPAPSATRDEVARSIPVDALATFITGHGGDFETGQWRVELTFPLSEPVSVDSWRQDLIDAITPKEDR